MKRLLVLVASLIATTGLVAQTPGTIVVSTTVTGSSGAASTIVTCVLSTPAKPAVHIVCSIGPAQVLVSDTTVVVGAQSGASGTFSNSGNAVTWIITRPDVTTITWQVSANGTSQTGNF